MQNEGGSWNKSQISVESLTWVRECPVAQEIGTAANSSIWWSMRESKHCEDNEIGSVNFGRQQGKAASTAGQKAMNGRTAIFRVRQRR